MTWGRSRNGQLFEGFRGLRVDEDVHGQAAGVTNGYRPIWRQTRCSCGRHGVCSCVVSPSGQIKTLLPQAKEQYLRHLRIFWDYIISFYWSGYWDSRDRLA